MDDIIEESESTAEERPECAVSYRYKVYRRPDLNHPVILRVRDYEHEVLESKGRIAGSCKMLDWTDWEVMVSNLFEKKYAEMTRLAAAGELEGCISSYARELNDQKKGIIESVKAENLGKEMEDFRIRDWSNDAAMALETDYPDTDGEVYEDGLMPDLVRSCQCERLTDGDADALCREKRYIVPLPGKIDWKFLRREARRPLFREPSEDGSAEQELMSADIRRLVALLLQAEYCRAMFAEAPDDGPELIGESYDPPEEKEVRQIEQSGRLARMELRRRICRAARLSDVTPEMAEHADGLIDRLLHSPGKAEEPFVSLSHLMGLPFMDAESGGKVSEMAEMEDTLLDDFHRTYESSCYNDRWMFDEAAREYLEEARKGDPTAMYSIGDMYYYGEGASDYGKKAVRWYLAAAERGNADAQRVIGSMYARGELVGQDGGKALSWLRKSADQGNDWAMFSLGTMYLEGQGVPKDYEKAGRWYEMAAEKGNAYARRRRRLIRLMVRADRGEPEAQGRLGAMYLSGDCVREDYDKAFSLLSLAAERGEADAMYWLGTMYRDGKGVAKSWDDALGWLSRAAECSDPRAAYDLARMFRWGMRDENDNIQHMDKDMAGKWHDSALWCCRHAADEGDPEADFLLSYLASDPEERANSLIRAAEHGHEEAACELGGMYENGGSFYEVKGRIRDRVAAAAWYRMAAEQGFAKAQRKLGELYCYSFKDFDEAEKWLLEAAEQGDYKAKEDLAGLYCEHGGEAELVKWYRESGSDAELRERGLPAGW